MKNNFRNHFGKRVARLSFVGLLSFLGAIAAVSCSSSEQQSGDQAVEAQVLTMKATDVLVERSYPANLKGKIDTEIHPQVSGFITKVCVEEGQKVSKGQLLFTIDEVTLEAAVRSAQAAVVSAKSNVSTCALTASQKKTLREKNIVGEYEYQTAQLALDAAKASLSQAEQALVQAQKNLSYSRVTSPCNGVVGTIDYREGSLVGPTTAALTTVSDISQMYAYISINESDMLAMNAASAQDGKSVLSSLPEVELVLADGTRYAEKGHIETISGVIDPQTGSASARALFANPGGVLRSGNTGNLIFPTTATGVFVIPQNATYELQDFRFALVLDKDNVAHAQKIKVLDVNDGQTFTVTEGLKAGDRVVVEGVGTTVRDGVKVSPKAATATAQKAEAKADNTAKK